MARIDYELEFLLTLDGYEFRFRSGYWVKAVPMKHTSLRGRRSR